ncbi:hypothetical protein [Methylobacter sp.]|uniref:phosphoribosyltransferase-like protein n=1 Tax=Methylobacter sp. TaxID=2051955 RepID=UPI00120AC203|nr:hypothetical protein [Methylobacter sp.]TAK62827.1 MAG: hypothetical protein EPO18_08685 [Methylobacter sp.]
MHLSIEPSKDNLNLTKIIRLLCNTKIRQPMNFEQIKTWLNQFDKGPEYTLALLILRFLIYRTSDQLVSSLKQALKCATKNFTHSSHLLETHDWREILNGTVNESTLCFNFGPVQYEYTQPGTSGEIITRLLRNQIGITKSKLYYTSQCAKLKPFERYLLVDDGLYTGDQLAEFIRQKCSFMTSCSQTGIVVALAHVDGIKLFKDIYPDIPVFYGERITSKNCFEAISKEWIDDGIWPYTEITPLEQYLEIVENKARFEKKMPLGYGNLGCLIAYDHGIPDDSLQLLWDKSDSWNPLIAR